MYSALFLERGKSKICRCGNYSRAETNQGRKLLIFRRFLLRKLFKGGNYSRAETIRGNTVVNFLAKTFLILNPSLENSTTAIAITPPIAIEARICSVLLIFFSRKHEFYGKLPSMRAWCSLGAWPYKNVVWSHQLLKLCTTTSVANVVADHNDLLTYFFLWENENKWL